MIIGCSGRLSYHFRHPTHSAGFSHSAGPRCCSITCGSVAFETSLSMISEHGRTRRSTPLRSTGRCTVELEPPPCSCGTGRCTADLRRKRETGHMSRKKKRRKSDFKHCCTGVFETMDALISAKHGCLLHSSRLSGFKLGSQSSLGMTPSVRQRTSRTR